MSFPVAECSEPNTRKWCDSCVHAPQNEPKQGFVGKERPILADRGECHSYKQIPVRLYDR